jgi:hypothetical protein
LAASQLKEDDIAGDANLKERGFKQDTRQLQRREGMKRQKL